MFMVYVNLCFKKVNILNGYVFLVKKGIKFCVLKKEGGGGFLIVYW